MSILPLWVGLSWGQSSAPQTPRCSIFKTHLFGQQDCKTDPVSAFVKDGIKAPDVDASPTPLELAYNSSVVLQREFWVQHIGYWPHANDWTSAFIHTAFAGMTDTLSRHLDDSYAKGVDAGMVENMVNSYFTQIVSFYFGQHHEALRDQVSRSELCTTLVRR